MPDSRIEEKGETVEMIIPIAAGALVWLTAGYVKTPFDSEIDEVEAATGVGGDLLRAIAKHESGFNPEAVSRENSNGTRDFGLMQINDRTAVHYGFMPTALVTSKTNPSRQVIVRSLTVAARLLKDVQRELGDKQNTYAVIAAYNAGSPAIKRRGIFNTPYVQSVLYHLQMFQFASIVRKRGGE